VTCATLFHSWNTCTGRRPNRVSHTSAHSYLGSVTYSQNNRSAVSYPRAVETATGRAPDRR
jgi:hypothetical protein